MVRKKMTVKVSIVMFAICMMLFCGYILLSAAKYGGGRPGEYGFAVDSQQRVYVGDVDKIRVYDAGEWVHSISPMPRGYVFTIIDGHILEIAGGVCYLAELEDIDFGNWKESVYESWEEHRLTTWRELSNQKEFTTTDGERYSLKITSGGYRIVKHLDDGNEEIILEQ